MQIDKSQILDLLKSQGDTGKADHADKDLPGTVGTDKDAGVLSKLGIDPQDLMSKLGGGGGGGGGGGLGGKLGL